MPRTKKPELRLPIKLTWGQRKMLAYADPGLEDRLKLDEPNQRIVCKASQKGEKIELPLDRIGVPEGSPYFQLLEDYNYWLANCQ